MKRKKEKRAISTLVATVLMILIVVAAVGMIWGVIMPMIQKSTQIGQACLNARLTIDTTSGYTCTDSDFKTTKVMVARGAEDFELAGIRIGLMSGGATKTYSVKQDPSADSLVAYWPLDDDVKDKSGNGNDGIIRGATSSEGKVGGALDFAQYAGNYVDMQNDENLKITGDITIEMWVKPSNLTGVHFFLSKNNVGEYEIGSNDNIFYYRHGDGSTYHSANWNNFFSSINIWYHVAIARTASDKTIKLYKNGVLFDNPSTYTIIPVASSNNLFIGDRSGGATRYFFGGVIDEIRVYNKALTAEEIANHAKAEIITDLPDQNEAKTIILSGTAEEVSVAPVVKIGRTEQVCEISARVNLKECI